MAIKTLIEKASSPSGGGSTGYSMSADPVAKGRVGLPNSKMDGETSMKPGATKVGYDEIDETDPETNVLVTTDNKVNAGTIKVKMTEDIAAMFSGTGIELTEQFLLKATTILEVAIQSQVDQIAEQMNEEKEQAIIEGIELASVALTDQVDQYMNYMAEQYIEENKQAITGNLRTELAESFMVGLKNLFDEHYVNIPDEAEDIVEGLVARVDELEEQLNTERTKNIEAQATEDKHITSAVFEQLSVGLTLTQKDRFATLAKGLETLSVGSVDDFKTKLAVIKESYFGTSVIASRMDSTVDTLLVEQSKPDAPIDPQMAKYVAAVSRSLTN